MPFGDLHQSPRLIELGYLQAKRWMAANIVPESTAGVLSAENNDRPHGCLGSS